MNLNLKEVSVPENQLPLAFVVEDFLYIHYSVLNGYDEYYGMRGSSNHLIVLDESLSSFWGSQSIDYDDYRYVQRRYSGSVHDITQACKLLQLIQPDIFGYKHHTSPLITIQVLDEDE